LRVSSEQSDATQKELCVIAAAWLAVNWFCAAGTYRFRTDPGKVWKVMEFEVEISQVWKIMENDLRYGKVWKSHGKCDY